MKKLRIVLVGKPNSGKSSLFNHLTGIHQKIGNFPGVTVDKKVGVCWLTSQVKSEVIDMPGAYSIYPRSEDEKIISNVLLDRGSNYFPDVIVFVADATNLQGSLLLLLQLIDLRFPIILALTMEDLMHREERKIDLASLATSLGVPVVTINARKGHGIKELKKRLSVPIEISSQEPYQQGGKMTAAIASIRTHFELLSDYEACQYLQQVEMLTFLSSEDKQFIQNQSDLYQHDTNAYQSKEILSRYRTIHDLVKLTTEPTTPKKNLEKLNRIDAVLTHKVWGYVIFFVALFLIFQSVFSLAQYPMDLIDMSFVQVSRFLHTHFSDLLFFNLLVQGVLPGLSGIMIFIPQIAILFFFIAVLEETGYMARAAFLMDKIMRKFGMHGKSIVPLISGWACAIPAVMAARTIENWKNRLITIFVVPLMSCSARLPVYMILIALVVPDESLFGFIMLRGLGLMGLYLLGVLATIGSAWWMKKVIRTEQQSFLFMELPVYRLPHWPNVFFVILQKVKAFVLGAGKIILAISVILWMLASYGPADGMEKAEQAVREKHVRGEIKSEELNRYLMATKMEHSYIGIMGKAIEPAIAPLGYDWKIGIALIVSFAAREVFVSALAIIYSVGDEGDPVMIRHRLEREKNPVTGQPRFTAAVGWSLLVFYTFAMQCMSTFAVVKRETKKWKWPILQLVYMTCLAYFSALIVYHLLS